MSRPTECRLATDDGSVRAVLHPADGRLPGVVLTHGAGGDLEDDGLRALAGSLAAGGAPTVRCNLPFRERGGRPPRADRAVGGFRQLVASARGRLGTSGLVVGGKSYGGRVASLAVAAGLAVDGLLLYGYPLHPAGRPDRLRVEHWPQLDLPCLFLQGSRDALCDLDLLDANLGRLARPPHVHVVAGGDHSLRIARKASPDGRVHRPDEVLGELGREVVTPWLSRLAGRER